MFQQQLQEIQSVIARYRGPLLESGVFLSQLPRPPVALCRRAVLLGASLSSCQP